MLKLSLAFVAMLSLSSCATIFTGTKDRIYFKSTPDGATVSKNGNDLCKTPCSVPIKRTLGSAEVEVSKEGYDSKVVSLDKEFNAVSIINLFSIIGWAIDLGTGSVSKYDRKSYDIELHKTKPGN